MVEIQKTIDRGKNLTIFMVSGIFSFEQITESIRLFYAGEFTLNIIYDLTFADMSTVSPGQMEAIVEFAKKHAVLRNGGRTALVLPDDLGYGLARMYESFSEIQGHTIAHKVCRKMDEAVIWIQQYVSSPT